MNNSIVCPAVSGTFIEPTRKIKLVFDVWAEASLPKLTPFRKATVWICSPEVGLLIIMVAENSYFPVLGAANVDVDRLYALLSSWTLTL